MINIKVDFKDKRRWDTLSRYIENNLLYGEVQAAMPELADKVVDSMRNTIKEKIKRHPAQGNLEKTIEKEILNTTGGIEIGIGNIEKLKTDAPYYEVLDQGGYIPYETRKGAPLGSFEGDTPDGTLALSERVQTWERSGYKGYFMKPRKAIEPVGYVEAGINTFETNLDSFLKSIDVEIINTIEKI